MVSSWARNAPKSGPSGIDRLPDDVVILILSQCQIDDILSFCLTNRRLYTIILAYITTIGPSVARRTFPNAVRLLNRPLEGNYTLAWLKGLIPQQLAAILVDRHRFAHDWGNTRYGIPAEDPWGDELRTRVVNGWHVLQKLSAISQEAYKLKPSALGLSTKELGLALFSPTRFRFVLTEARERHALERRLVYIESLPESSAKDYKLMFLLLSSVFRMSLSTNNIEDYIPWIFDWGHGIDGQRLLRRGNSWMTWYILHEGPSIFWQQWCVQDPANPESKNYIRDKSLQTWLGKDSAVQRFTPNFPSDEWKDVNEKEHALQRDSAYKVQLAMEKQTGSQDRAMANQIPSLFDNFTRYSDCRRLRFQEGAPEPDETMTDVPFHVEFRCPEELNKRYSVLRLASTSRLPRD
ncbi:uncharacterized protein BDZ99DRAFT_457068 [Mytilinidion resinicola]|uniref:F-box domain-containing protein n=1 Tax=Mytilinidion resinicola TaxID=574789 RepID=A0A6A6Z8H9_9PEZI|nr:uncharacterized protein BDZ99DRAFT_457068 [Mytilinidion resinicola]KAF2817320.1 hypothetical protein BDZ99DRAFT_457068 [Mytilinidion resinicola]